jgi:hypothetical protein
LPLDPGARRIVHQRFFNAIELHADSFAKCLPTPLLFLFRCG